MKAVESLAPARILVIDDEEDGFQETSAMLRDTAAPFPPQVEWARGYDAGLEALKAAEWTVCLLSDPLGPHTALGLLTEARKTGIALPPVVVLAATEDRQPPDESSFLEAGAYDLLPKADCTPALLARSIRYALNQMTLTQRLEHANAELRRFCYAASHDLKEPLRTIAGFSQLLHRRYHDKLDPEANELIEFVASAAKRLNTMISDLLNYSRLDAPTAPALVDCEELLSYTLTTLSAAIREAGATITHGPMPAIIGEPLKLEQIFLNLLSNAVKFRGGRKPVIHVAAEELPDRWQFSVRDNGIGIAPADQENIMEVFIRVAQDYPGTGIGLAIAKKAAEQHGGRLWVESTPGEGSTFYFTIVKGGEK